MSAAKHTPGEWVVKSWTEHDKAGAIESCGDQVVARLPNGDEVGIFTTALEGESLADLRLIAAAPCLLEALSIVVSELQSVDLADLSRNHAARRAHVAAKKAIAKATGEGA